MRVRGLRLRPGRTACWQPTLASRNPNGPSSVRLGVKKPGSSPRKEVDFLGRVLIVAAVAIGFLLVWTWRHVFLLAFAAILLAVGVHGLADPIRRLTRLGKSASLALAMLVLFGVIGGVFYLFGAEMSAQASALSNDIPEAWDSLRPKLLASPLGAEIVEMFDRWRSGADVAGSVSRTVLQIGGWTLSLVGAATNVLLVIIAAIFFAVNPGPYRRGLLLLFPNGTREKINQSLDLARRALRRWLLGTLVSMTAIALMVGTGLSVLGVPSFIALALIAGLAQIVPIVGPNLAVVPALLLALSIGFDTALWTALLYLTASQIEANFITPLVQDKAVSIKPAMILFSIFAMGALFGPLGVILAVPLAIVVMILVIAFYVNGVVGEQVRAPGERALSSTSAKAWVS